MATTKIIEKIETEVQAAARRKGLTMGALAARMGVTIGYLSQIANGHRKWTPRMRAKVISVLGEVPGQGKVHIRQESVDGESTYIRERARELGLTMRDVAARAGLSHSYVSKAALHALTIATANELRGKVPVNALSPGWVKTDMAPTGPGDPRNSAQAALSILMRPRDVTGKLFRGSRIRSWSTPIHVLGDTGMM